MSNTSKEKGRIYISKKAHQVHTKDVVSLDYYARQEKYGEVEEFDAPPGFWLVPDTKFEIRPSGVKPSYAIDRTKDGFVFDKVVSAPQNLSGVIYLAAPDLPPKFAEIIRYWGREPLGQGRATQAIYHQNPMHEYMINLRSDIDVQFVLDEAISWWNNKGKQRLPLQATEPNSNGSRLSEFYSVTPRSSIGKTVILLSKMAVDYGLDLVRNLPDESDREELYALLVSLGGEDDAILSPDLPYDPQFSGIMERVRKADFWKHAVQLNGERAGDDEDGESDRGHLLITEGQVIHLKNLPDIIEENQLSAESFIAFVIPIDTNLMTGSEGDFFPGNTEFKFDSDFTETIWIKVSDILGSPDPRNVYIDLFRYDNYDYGYFY